MQKRLIIGSVFGVLLVGAVAFAKTSTTTHPGQLLNKERRNAATEFNKNRKEERKDTRQDIRADRKEARTDITGKRIETEKLIREKRLMMRSASTTPEERAKVRTEIKQERQTFQQERQDLWQKYLEEAKTRRDAAKTKIAEYRTMLQNKLKTVRDERKKVIVNRLDNHFEQVQDKFVINFNNVIKNLEDILGRVDTRSDKLATAGRDTTKVESAVASARSLIDEAKKKISDFAGKTYPISITTEDKLGEASSKARQALHNDTVATRDAVQKAREAVQNAFQELKSITGTDESTATPTPATTPTSSPTPTP